MKLKWNIVTDEMKESGESELTAGPFHLVQKVNGTIENISASVKVKTEDDEKVFMNGYQTWTVCKEYGKNDRIRGMHRIPSMLKQKFKFDRYGDYHFVNYPYRKGIVHGFSYCYFRKGNVYRLFASLSEQEGYTMFTYDFRTGTLTIKKDNRGVKHQGDMNVLDLFYAEGSEDEVFDAWFKEMNIKPLTDQKLYGYSSWYNRYEDINEPAIRQDLSGCETIFEKGDLFQIDDGWEPHVGDWLETDPAKFPNGLKPLVDEIHEKGFKAGLWLAPFVAETESDLYKNHQDWFLKVNGSNWCNGSNWSEFYSLDIDNPEVIAYLEKCFDRVLNEWGFDLVKLDFLYGAAPFGNERESRAARMIRGVDLLRKWCGDKTILGCGVPVMPAFGKFEYCRISCDVSLDWDDKAYMRMFHRERVSTKNAVNNIIYRRQLNNRAYLSDPDVFFLREENLKLTDMQKESLVRLDALEGGVFLTSDDPTNYTDQMKRDYKKYRHLTEAVDVSITTGDAIRVSYTLDGQKTSRRLFGKNN